MYNRAKECMKSIALAAGRYSGMGGGTGGGGGAAPTKYKAWGIVPTIAHSHDSDTASLDTVFSPIDTTAAILRNHCPGQLVSRSMSQRFRRTSVESRYVVAPPKAQ